ncbi:ATP-binding protein, partial [Dactylosporangium sp. NPDC051485]|uniref:ATP-binding protein n=1 Tax=Dactylosporangium sp. NPDC051485 TaxID=3154846 RepID=UPI00343A3FF6
MASLPVPDLVGRGGELRLIDSLLGPFDDDPAYPDPTPPFGEECPLPFDDAGPVPECSSPSPEPEALPPLLDRPGLLLRGDPGIGKSVLLDAAAARAESAGATVLRAGGVSFEAGIGYSALHQLLDPLREEAARLPDGHRYALDDVFSLAPGPVPNPPVFAAVLDLLRAAAAERPLLLVVDDLPWVDGASAAALGFAARRVTDEPLTLLAAARTAADGPLDGLRLPERQLRPLALRPAAALLAARWPGLAPQVQ